MTLYENESVQCDLIVNLPCAFVLPGMVSQASPPSC